MATQPASEEEAAIAAAIEQTLAQRAAALAAGDRAAFLATIDQRNLTWRRIQGDVFEASARRGPPDRYTVTHLQPKPGGYYKAWIDITPTGASRPARWVVWVFHSSDHGWLLAEPLNEELGTRRTRESEHFVLAYYPWDDDVIDRMVAVAEQGHAKATARLGITPDIKAQLSVNPTYASHSGLQETGVLAAYLSGTKTMILVRSLESYGAGSTAAGQRQEERLLTAVTHEYTHLINDRIVPLVKEPEWMQEGLAIYVSDDLWPDVMRSALRAGRTVPLEKASDIISWKLDPARGYTQADITLAYAESGYAVAYFIQRFGQQTFFDLARAFAESRRWEESFSQATGGNWEQFQSDWLAWTRRQVGA